MMAGRIGIACGVASKPEADGILSASMLTPERRSPKVGALPDKARMVLAAARRCLPEDGSPARETAGETGVSLGTYTNGIED